MYTITSEFLDRTGSGRNSYTGNDSLVLNGGSAAAPSPCRAAYRGRVLLTVHVPT
jgi:hypothetical protein